MQQVRLTKNLSSPVSIYGKSIIYPHDDQAIYQGVSFGGKSIHECVHFKTCIQLSRRSSVKDLHYYHWTIEKLHRYGDKYEAFLTADDKGCGVDKVLLDAMKDDPCDVRYEKLAVAATESFVKLFNSIKESWNPELITRELQFYKLFNKKFTIEEGRHRVAILSYIYGDDVTFLIDKKNIKRGYYVNKFKKIIKRFSKNIISIKRRSLL